ncbi:MAG: enoyl-CoA hydratase/isomerase family protein [Verrucomicrobia bacterium]|nr:enoyl-CoA hydratase/isomerase family protein [Verrucomicrobiota bacterium]
MRSEVLTLRRAPRQLIATLSRPEHGNSLNSALIRELGAAVDLAERTPDCRTLVVEGVPGLFCTGLDFEEGAAPDEGRIAGNIRISDYFRLLKRFTESPRIIVSRVDGRVIGGGAGLVAASDVVLATERSEFSLPEALWGLLPCCVLPFLMRRVGFQKAYIMTLTTRPLGAVEAHAIRLVDELTNDLDESLRKLTLRLNLLRDNTIVDMKRYFYQLSGISTETEEAAISELSRLIAQEEVQRNIRNYVLRGTFPWEQQGV